MSDSAALALDLFRNADAELPQKKALVGLDGFVDTIIHVVDKRESASSYTRLGKMGSFGERISAAAGFSANFEFVRQMVKLGGNGPIMANALARLSLPVSYVGNLGDPKVHPVFDHFTQVANVHSIAEPGYTDAIEFNDGKLMFGRHDSLHEVTWERLLEKVGEPQLEQLFSDAELISLVNWTMLPHMSEIFRKIYAHLAPRIGGGTKYMFFDLADPAKRTSEDVEGVLKLISQFQRHFRVILGLNQQESRQVGEVLGIPVPAEDMDAITSHARSIHEQLNVHTVVVHPVSFAAAADDTGATAVRGPFTSKPKITTGAGDHFNAGFCVGRMLGGNLEASLQSGVATSGFYVRNAISPTVADLRTFLEQLQQEKV